MLLDLMEDEAEIVIEAISATAVRFGGLTLIEVLEMAPQLRLDATIAHDVCSGGTLYSGGPKLTIKLL